MNRLFLAIAMLVLPAILQAQEDQREAADRARIATERAQAEAVFRDQEKACYRKFAVTDCLNAAKAQRRQVLADLRRQEVSINEAQRKRKAAEHLRSLEERSSPDKQQKQDQQRAKALDEQRSREAAAARKANDRASSEAEAPAKAAARQEQVERRQAEARADQTKRAEEAARNVKRRQQRLAEAQDRRASMDKRLAERKKPKAQPLPPPPP
jgi:colicin import membrane protein